MFFENISDIPSFRQNVPFSSKIACCNCTLLTGGLRSGCKMVPFSTDQPKQLEWYFSHLEDTKFILLGKEF